MNGENKCKLEVNEKEKVDILPCPFCNSTGEFDFYQWIFGAVKIDAIECLNCFASAPLNVWQDRVKSIQQCPACSECFTSVNNPVITKIEVV